MTYRTVGGVNLASVCGGFLGTFQSPGCEDFDEALSMIRQTGNCIFMACPRDKIANHWRPFWPHALKQVMNIGCKANVKFGSPKDSISEC